MRFHPKNNNAFYNLIFKTGDILRMRCPKLRNQKGQHTIEYILLLTLIMAGILIGGRYVIRSWNANLKGWEDSAVDSVQDPLLQDDDLDLPECLAGPWERAGCGLNPSLASCAGTPNCSEREMTQVQPFNPVGCNCGLSPKAPSRRCVVDPCCCTQPTTTGVCGADQINFRTGFSKPTCATNVQMIPKNFDGTCPSGMMEAWTLCGLDADPIERRYGCVSDSSCVLECLTPANPPPLSDSWPVNPKSFFGPSCVGDDLFLPNPAPNNIFVFYGACTTRKCETQCSPGSVVLNNGFDCGPCPILGIIRNNCPASTPYSLDGCSSPQIKSCCFSLSAPVAPPPLPPRLPTWQVGTPLFCPTCRGYTLRPFSLGPCPCADAYRNCSLFGTDDVGKRCPFLGDKCIDRTSSGQSCTTNCTSGITFQMRECR